MADIILVIESDAYLRKEVTSALIGANFTVVGVPDYQEAITKLQRFTPDMIVTNEALLSGEGIEVCKQIYHILDVPIVVFSEESSDEVWKRVMEVGACLCLVKPVSSPQLVARVKAVLRRYRLSAQEAAEARKISEKQDPASLLLTSEDRANGFSIVVSDRRNITLLKRGKPIAWFSAAMSRKVQKEFVQLVKGYERNAKGGNAE